MYADDTVLLTCGEDQKKALDIKQSLFNNYVEWTSANGLKINVSKTKHMMLCAQNKNVDTTLIELRLNTIPACIPTCNRDKNLVLESFVKYILQRVNFKLYLFSKIRYLLKFEAAMIVYK